MQFNCTSQPNVCQDQLFFGDLKERRTVDIIDVCAESFAEFLQLFYLSKIYLTTGHIGERRIQRPTNTTDLRCYIYLTDISGHHWILQDHKFLHDTTGGVK